MIYKNLLHWLPLPEFQDGDIVEGGNLVGQGLIDGGKKVRFIGCNLKGSTTTLPQLPEDRNAIGPLPEPEPEQPPTYPELAANAEIVLNALKGSGKLTDEQVLGLEYLAANVKQIAGIDSEIGEVTTQKTLEIVNKLKELGYNEFATQIEQAMLQIQEGWN
jgi:hypothetical protein